MKLHSLHYALGSKKKSVRVGRGYGSQRGGTCKRGSNGNKSRSGYTHKYGFEGGQTPLYKKIPIVGFKSINKKVYKIITFDNISSLFTAGINVLDENILKEKGFINSVNTRYKVLSNGNLDEKLKGVKISADGFSKKALEILQSKGCECLLRNGQSL